MLMSYPTDTIASLLKQESHPDYIVLHHPYAEPSSSKSQEALLMSWRVKIGEWIFEVVDHYELERETAIIALNFLDRYAVRQAQIGSPLDKSAFGLAATTSLYLATKLHGKSSCENINRRLPGIRQFVPLTKGKFTRNQITQMELKILQTLKWKVNPPLPIYFVSLFLEAFLPDWESGANFNRSCVQMKDALNKICTYLAELSMCFADFSPFQPSSLAYASILVALEALEQDLSSEGLIPPQQIVWDFCNNVFVHTALKPGTEQVAKARETLVQRCPNIFAEAANIALHCRTYNPMGGFDELLRAFRNETFTPPDQNNIAPVNGELMAFTAPTQVMEMFDTAYGKHSQSMRD